MLCYLGMRTGLCELRVLYKPGEKSSKADTEGAWSQLSGHLLVTGLIANVITSSV